MMAKKDRPKPSDARRVGGVRPSQLMYTYGVGSLVDLPSMTVLVGALDHWTQHRVPIREPRLLEAVQALLGPQVRRLDGAPQLEETNNPFDEWTKEGVPVFPFPRWLRCTNPKCNRLATVDSGLFRFEGNAFAPNRARFIHENCAGSNSKRTALPVRFVLACPAGHLDDFPWVEFCHGYAPCPNTPHGDPVLKLLDSGLAARATDQRVECEACGANQGLNVAFGPHAKRMLPACRGRHPHLQLYEPDCQIPTKAMLVGATNLWFPVTRNALSLPDVQAPIDVMVADQWDNLAQIESAPEIALVRKYNVELAARLTDFTDGEVFAAIERYRSRPEQTAEPDLFGPEWRVFSGPPLDLPDLVTEQVSPPSGHTATLLPTVIAHRLRAVTAFCGFTRIDVLDEAELEEIQITQAPISRTRPTWVPAAEARGEGLVVRLDEAAVQAWEERVAGHPRILELQDAATAWRVRRNLPAGKPPTARFILVHSFAHLLLHQVALDCGYSTASLKERVYARDVDSGDPMAGVLIYTADTDSEGTLGGLVALGEPDTLGRLVTEGLHRAALCSGDPLCAEHHADYEQGTSLHGAACHSCLFLPEIPCEHGNRALDRAVLLPTIAVADLAFFAQP